MVKKIIFQLTKFEDWLDSKTKRRKTTKKVRKIFIKDYADFIDLLYENKITPEQGLVWIYEKPSILNHVLFVNKKFKERETLEDFKKLLKSDLNQAKQLLETEEDNLKQIKSQYELKLVYEPINAQEYDDKKTELARLELKMQEQENLITALKTCALEIERMRAEKAVQEDNNKPEKLPTAEEIKKQIEEDLKNRQKEELKQKLAEEKARQKEEKKRLKEEEKARQKAAKKKPLKKVKEKTQEELADELLEQEEAETKTTEDDLPDSPWED